MELQRAVVRAGPHTRSRPNRSPGEKRQPYVFRPPPPLVLRCTSGRGLAPVGAGDAAQGYTDRWITSE
jgi:hypothetical protein